MLCRYNNKKGQSSFQSFEEVSKCLDELVKENQCIKIITNGFNDFLFVLTHDNAINDYKENAKDISFLDSVYKITDLSTPIWVFGHVTKSLHGIPTFVIFSSENKSNYLGQAISAIRDHLKKKSIELSKSTIIDKDNVEIKALEENGIKILFCKVSLHRFDFELINDYI